MFNQMNQSAGSMYEEIENARLKKEHHGKIILRRTIAIIILAFIVSYLGLLLYDINRFHNGKLPLINIKTVTKDYDDGQVISHYSIGWVFRFYQRETITDSEIVPFWYQIRLDNVLKRVNDPNLPDIETDYTVPSNESHYEKVDNVLFFYDADYNLLGTYACLLSKSDCEISYADYLTDDSSKEPIKMGIIDNRYVFITEYKNYQTAAQEKHVYLYDIVAQRYIAEYEGVRYSILAEDGKGDIDSSKYIIMKNGYWGIDQVIKGLVSNILDYKYCYLSFNADNSIYILKTNYNTWLTYNANKKTYTQEILNKISDLYVVNDKVYIITYEVDENNNKNYKLFKEDGTNVLSKDNIDNLKPYDKFLIYTNDSYLQIIDYDGNELIGSLLLYFEDYSPKSTYNIKPYYLTINGSNLDIKVLRSSDKTHFSDIYYYNMDDWSLIKSRVNVKETLS